MHVCEPYYIIRDRLIAPPEGEDDNLTCGPKAEGDEAAEACGDEEGLVAFSVPVVELVAQQRHGTPTEECKLHLMGMAAEGELGSAVRDDLTSPRRRIMFEHDDERIPFYALQRLFDITFLGEFDAVAVVLHTCDDDARLLTIDVTMLVHQQRPAHLPLQTHSLTTVRHLPGRVAADVVAIVVIAEHGVDAVLRLQTAQHVHVAIEILGFGILDVTQKHDEVWPLGVHAVDGLFQDVLIMLVIRTHMGVGEDHDLVAVEGLWQVFRDEGLAIHLHFVEADERPIEQDIPDDGHTDQSYEVTIILAPMEQLTDSESQDGTQHKHCLGHGYQSEQQQINP